MAHRHMSMSMSMVPLMPLIVLCGACEHRIAMSSVSRCGQSNSDAGVVTGVELAAAAGGVGTKAGAAGAIAMLVAVRSSSSHDLA